MIIATCHTQRETIATRQRSINCYSRMNKKSKEMALIQIAWRKLDRDSNAVRGFGRVSIYALKTITTTVEIAYLTHPQSLLRGCLSAPDSMTQSRSLVEELSKEKILTSTQMRSPPQPAQTQRSSGRRARTTSRAAFLTQKKITWQMKVSEKVRYWVLQSLKICLSLLKTIKKSSSKNFTF